MNETNLRPMPKVYSILWGVIALAYALWMTFIMRPIILNNYETPAGRTVDGLLYDDITGFMGHHWLFPIWVIVSTAILLLFPVCIKKLLYAEKLGNFAKWFCLIGAIVGCVYIVAFGFLDTYARDGSMATFSDKLHYVTASMIGLTWPWLFKLWGILGGLTLFTNAMYAFRKYDYSNKAAVIMGSLGAAAIYLTINCPSFGETKDFSVPRCLAHWSGALIFAVCIAAPFIILLFAKARQEKGRFLAMLIVAVVFLGTMLVLLITVGKSAMIENLPMVGGYLLAILLNFTNVFEPNQE